LHIAINKPVGYVCSLADDDDENASRTATTAKRRSSSNSNDKLKLASRRETQLVYDLLPDSFRRRLPTLSVAGRLDKWATGLCILSQNGDLVHRIISPKRKLAKVYVVHCLSPFNGTEARVLASGELKLKSEETPCAPAIFEAIDVTGVR
jgi:16S rRNA U516 pseudouridylate synthase RsuA-like enzyme